MYSIRVCLIGKTLHQDTGISTKRLGDVKKYTVKQQRDCLLLLPCHSGGSLGNLFRA